MLDQCANPACGKPLHSLRDGRVFAFDTTAGSAGADGRRLRRTEHYWLCGECAVDLVLERSPEGAVSVHPSRAAGRGGYFACRAVAS